MTIKSRVRSIEKEMWRSEKANKEIQTLGRFLISRIQKQCDHKNNTYYPDPSGNNGSFRICDDCGLEF